ncbi:MAG: c-type cytochrome domain-containing protein, partial [Chloroherpetonaceae bacterium]|nr:c-type cytochrome domain-containing protein [Chloroherpetonaceae bacterium]
MSRTIASGLLIGVLLRQPAFAQIDFDRDVRPILSQHCFACHGPDARTRMAALRLDTRQGATRTLPSGRRAIVPGHPDRSELI